MNLNVIDHPDFDLGLLSVEHTSELLGTILRLPQQQQVAVFKKMARKANPSMEHNSRTKMMRVLHLFPSEIQKGLLDKRLQLVDTSYYFVKSVAAVKNIKMIADTDNKAPGLGNVSKQKLEKENHFCLTDLILTAGVAVAKEDVVFDVIPTTIMNGDFECKINGGKYVTPASRVPCTVFDTNGRTDIQRGLWPLHNPKAVEAEQAMEFNVDFAAPAIANTWLRLEFKGSSVTPY